MYNILYIIDHTLFIVHYVLWNLMCISFTVMCCNSMLSYTTLYDTLYYVVLEYAALC